MWVESERDLWLENCRNIALRAKTFGFFLVEGLSFFVRQPLEYCGGFQPGVFRNTRLLRNLIHWHRLLPWMTMSRQWGRVFIADNWEWCLAENKSARCLTALRDLVRCYDDLGTLSFMTDSWRKLTVCGHLSWVCLVSVQYFSASQLQGPASVINRPVSAVFQAQSDVGVRFLCPIRQGSLPAVLNAARS